MVSEVKLGVTVGNCMICGRKGVPVLIIYREEMKKGEEWVYWIEICKSCLCNIIHELDKLKPEVMNLWAGS